VSTIYITKFPYLNSLKKPQYHTLEFNIKPLDGRHCCYDANERWLFWIDFTYYDL